MRAALPNLARPDIAFVAPWGLVLLGYFIIPSTPLTPPFATPVAFMLSINMLTAPIIYWLVKRSVERRHGLEPGIAQAGMNAVSIDAVSRAFAAVTAVWAMGYVASIIYSGGLPIVWAVTGNSRSYSDFGLPSIGGLSNMLRCLSMILAILLFQTTRRTLYLVLWLLLFISCLAELSRSGAFVVLLYSICTYFVLTNIKFRHLLMALPIVGVALGLFIWIGSLRNIVMSSQDFQINSLNGLPPSLYWAWAYLVSPLGNLNHAAAVGFPISGYPNFVLQSFLPTVLRALIFPHQTYPIPLISDALNATSMYAPLCADFGFVGATLATSALQVYATFAFVWARRGSVLYICIYPALFASLVLSVFYIYVATLGVVLFPFVCAVLVRFVRGEMLRTLPTAAIVH